jgi:hypothetical protein
VNFEEAAFVALILAVWSYYFGKTMGHFEARHAQQSEHSRSGSGKLTPVEAEAAEIMRNPDKFL